MSERISNTWRNLKQSLVRCLWKIFCGARKLDKHFHRRQLRGNSMVYYPNPSPNFCQFQRGQSQKEICISLIANFTGNPKKKQNKNI